MAISLIDTILIFICYGLIIWILDLLEKIKMAKQKNRSCPHCSWTGKVKGSWCPQCGKYLYSKTTPASTTPQKKTISTVLTSKDPLNL